MSDSNVENCGPGYPSLTRRERLARIAAAERDRREGRIDLAIATIGEPVEWPARVVIALARLSNAEAESETRRLLEEGLDLWARESGLGDLSTDSTDQRASEPESATDPLGLVSQLSAASADLDTPVEASELEEAFAAAETDVDSMHDVNDVAERVLMHESDEFPDTGSFDSAALTPVTPLVEDDIQFGSYDEADPTNARPNSIYDVEPIPDRLGMDAAHVQDAPNMLDDVTDALAVGRTEDAIGVSSDHRNTLATLERWLGNLERRMEGSPS